MGVVKLNKVYQIRFPDYVTVQVKWSGSARDLSQELMHLRVGLKLVSGTILNPQSFVSIVEMEEKGIYTYLLSELLKQ